MNRFPYTLTATPRKERPVTSDEVMTNQAIRIAELNDELERYRRILWYLAKRHEPQGRLMANLADVPADFDLVEWWPDATSVVLTAEINNHVK